MRAGLLCATIGQLPFVKRCLPVEHAIVAERGSGSQMELIVEGPMLPDWLDGAQPPARVDLVARAEVINERNNRVQLVASWRVDGVDTAEWTIGTWPSVVEISRDIHG